jgi:hypothetical protein
MCSHRMRWLVVACFILTFTVALVGCGGTAATPAMRFTTPSDGATVKGPKVKVEMRVTNWKLVPAGGALAEGEGHLHFFISSFVVTGFGRCLMLPPPQRPRYDKGCRWHHRPHQAPQQAPHFGYAQRDQSPRWALNCARLLGLGPFAIPPHSTSGTSAGALARIAVRNAWARQANVICLYQPLQLRTW